MALSRMSTEDFDGEATIPGGLNRTFLSETGRAAANHTVRALVVLNMQVRILRDTIVFFMLYLCEIQALGWQLVCLLP